MDMFLITTMASLAAFARSLSLVSERRKLLRIISSAHERVNERTDPEWTTSITLKWEVKKRFVEWNGRYSSSTWKRSWVNKRWKWREKKWHRRFCPSSSSPFCPRRRLRDGEGEEETKDDLFEGYCFYSDVWMYKQGEVCILLMGTRIRRRWGPVEKHWHNNRNERVRHHRPLAYHSLIFSICEQISSLLTSCIVNRCRLIPEHVICIHKMIGKNGKDCVNEGNSAIAVGTLVNSVRSSLENINTHSINVPRRTTTTRAIKIENKQLEVIDICSEIWHERLFVEPCTEQHETLHTTSSSHYGKSNNKQLRFISCTLYKHLPITADRMLRRISIDFQQGECRERCGTELEGDERTRRWRTKEIELQVSDLLTMT